MFDPVSPKQSLPDLERGILEYWRENDTFKRSLQERRDGERFSFYDGPPFATGLPHYGHLLAGTVKDVIPRYQTMCGKYIERCFGWDCHGLPIENLIEKEHNIQGKQEIEEKGIRWFNELCRGSVQRYTKEWRTTVERMGRWVDMDNDYRTMDPDYMESIWWVFSELWNKKLIEEGHKPMHVCPRCVTPLSNFEVTLGYKEISDLAVTAKFRVTRSACLVDEQQKNEQRTTYLLAWTTTPWTLPGNLFLAIHPKVTYVLFEQEGDSSQYIASEQFVKTSNEQRATSNKDPYSILKKFQGSEIIHCTYAPLFPYFANDYKDSAFRIIEADFVTTDEGTGIVHIAPGYGADDYEIGKREDVPLLQHVTMEGRFIDAVKDFAGQEVKPKDDSTKTDRKIVEHLEKSDHIFSSEKYRHSYPHCWRCDSPLLNYATTSWFVTVEKFKEKLLTNNKETRWVPGHIRDGRFGNWLENAKDWAISRNRYWGTPLPIWQTEGGEETVVINGRDELMRYCTDRFTKITVLRHGESEGNVNKVYQNSPPGTDLTKKGKEQAKEAAKWLQEQSNTQSVAVIYSSPLERCQQTAKILAKEIGAEVIVDERIRETGFNECDGKPVIHDEDQRFRALHKASARGEDTESPWERWQDIQKRIDAFFEEILPKHKGNHIVVVSHGDPLHNVEHFFTKEEPGKIVEHPMARFASPKAYFWDHEQNAQMDLHRENIDDITWEERGKRFHRIPEVFDCWFESGSMPYAQENYPFSWSSQLTAKSSQLPPGFPADFIAENLDQTRGWFYTLMVLGTALFKKPAFWNCICGGIILAEDGKKMSKSLKNYPDPNELMERQGADALRFAMMSSPVVRAESLRFSEDTVHEVVQNTLLPLWNAYSFFVTYANAAEFEPSPVHSTASHPLDQWMRAELQDLTNRMTEQLDRYDLSATCDEIHETIDALTNWYIRLSRRRFAGKTGNTQEQLEGLQTLYDCLLQLSQLLAPFCPFITEAIYVNLSEEKNGSVHLTRWPEVRELQDHELEFIEKNRIMRRAVSLGLKVRAEAKVKIRQPLATARIAIPPESVKHFSKEDFALLRDELNVKTLTLVENPEDLAIALALVDARKVGPRLGKRVQEIIKAGKEGEFMIGDDGNIRILDEMLSPEEVEITYKGKEGENIAGDQGIVISIDTELTPELEREGTARDLIRAVQKLRQEAGLSFTDQIRLSIDGANDIMTSFGDVIAEETRSHIAKNKGEKHEVQIGDNVVTMQFEKIDIATTN